MKNNGTRKKKTGTLGGQLTAIVKQIGAILDFQDINLADLIDRFLGITKSNFRLLS